LTRKNQTRKIKILILGTFLFFNLFYIMDTSTQEIALIHPGDILREEYISAMGLSSEKLAEETGITVDRINAILEAEAPVSADVAVAFSLYFQQTVQMWMRFQNDYDLIRHLNALIAQGKLTREQAKKIWRPTADVAEEV